MTTETLAAFSRRLGVARSTVTRAAKNGRLVLDAAGLVQIEQSLARWHATEAGTRPDVSARHAVERGAAIPVATATPGNPASGPQSAPATDASLDAAVPDLGRARFKAMGLHFENSSLKLAMALARGLRYPNRAANQEANNLGGMTRAALERLVDQLAPRLAACSNELERRHLIDRELRRVAWMLRAELPRSLRRLRKAANQTKDAA